MATEQTLMTLRERSALVSAQAVFSSSVAANGASIALYRRDTSGGKQTLIAQSDGASAGATAWTAFRSKALTVPTATIVLEPGETITAVCAGPTPTVTLTLRRVD